LSRNGKEIDGIIKLDNAKKAVDKAVALAKKHKVSEIASRSLS
jgi:hypothetical protein